MFAFATREVGSDPFLHLMAAMAIDAVRCFSIAAQQRSAVDAPFICRDEAGCRRHRRLDIRIVEVAGQTEFVLGDLQLGGVFCRGNVSDRVSVTFDAARSSFDPRNLCVPVRRLCECLANVSMA